MVLRGYDRIEVDQFIDGILEENAALRRELESRRAAPADRDDRPAPAREAPPAPYYDVDTPAEDSFGFRAEKLLRLAEREAAEMRTRATRDAEAVEATSRRRAEEQLRAAEKEADDIRSEASQAAAGAKKQAAQEAARLSLLHRNTKDELRRLAGLLTAEVERPDPDDGSAPADGPATAAPNVPAQQTAVQNAETPASNH
jgi:hypothetical protein